MNGLLTMGALALSLAQGQTTLTLDDALRRATEANYDLKAAYAKLDQAHAGVWKAWSAQLPQVGAGASYTHNDVGADITLPTGYYIRDFSPTQQGPDAGGSVAGSPTTLGLVPSGLVTATIQKQDQLGAQIAATQALFAPQAWYIIRAAYAGETVADRTVEGVRRDVLFGVAGTYYGVASFKKLADVAQQLLEIAVRQEKDAEVRYKAGTIAKVGLLRAQIDRARAEQDLLRAKNAYQSVRISLAVLLDRAPDFDVVEPTEPALPADPTTLEDAALRDRPDVQAARANQDLVAALRNASVARYLPSVGAFGRWQWANLGGFTGKQDSWAVGLALTWSIFDGGLREAEIREGNARMAEAEASLHSTELKARADVKQALLDLESARANAKKAKEQRDLAAENQRLVDVSFKAGAATAVEQADATAALRNAETALATETLSAQLAALRVLKSAGAFTKP